MEELLKHNCFPFLIVYFEKYSKFCKIDFLWLKKLDKRIIDFAIIEKECETYDLVFPGIINFVK
jgi:penicillin-binding protein-related factor A (putative recombinase)